MPNASMSLPRFELVGEFDETMNVASLDYVSELIGFPCMDCCFRKPHVNVGTIGHVDRGKTTLTAAITKVQC
ncbi:hypothetical protein RHGRI_003368 [Rhododendron griersonianum]|uniref:Tr-type G domain-containing protein n=1 Tax=Rhododendron griersonianum TaxID=479676 RepID=A0AAV6L6G8_9ERIC|nr:hypothetical protein RHGRI_003368 [Rhododendron griersonianum]